MELQNSKHLGKATGIHHNDNRLQQAPATGTQGSEPSVNSLYICSSAWDDAGACVLYGMQAVAKPQIDILTNHRSLMTQNQGHIK